MRRSVLLIFWVYSFIGLTFAIATTINPALKPFSPNSAGLFGLNLPFSNDQDIHREGQFQNQKFERSYVEDTRHDGKSYVRHGKTGFLNLRPDPIDHAIPNLFITVSMAYLNVMTIHDEFDL